jgi:hypothetical protein
VTVVAGRVDISVPRRLFGETVIRTAAALSESVTFRK